MANGDNLQKTQAASVLVAFTLALFGILEADALAVKLLCASAVVPLSFFIARLTGPRRPNGNYRADFSQLDRLAGFQAAGLQSLVPVRATRTQTVERQLESQSSANRRRIA